LFAASTASTRYVWLEPGVSPASVNEVVVAEPIEVGLPSRYTRYVIGSEGSVDAAQEIWICPGVVLEPEG
jgi:hypothetical protein